MAACNMSLGLHGRMAAAFVSDGHPDLRVTAIQNNVASAVRLFQGGLSIADPEQKLTEGAANGRLPIIDAGGFSVLGFKNVDRALACRALGGRMTNQTNGTLATMR